MDASNKIDMSLDEIIKLQRKSMKATASGNRARPSALRNSLRRGTKAIALHPSLAKRMKSRQASTAIAIFQKAQRTAAIAAKVAADAAAFVAPTRNLLQNGRRFPGAVGNQRIQGLAFNRTAAVNRKIMAVNQRIFQRQRHQAMRTNRQRVPANGNINNNNQRNQFAMQQRQFVSSRNQFVNRQQYNQRRVFNNSNPRGSSGRRVTAGPLGSRQLIVRTNNRNRNSGGQRYQQYIQQARALIRAQNEGRSGGNFYVEAPAGGRNVMMRRGGRGRGRFMR